MGQQEMFTSLFSSWFGFVQQTSLFQTLAGLYTPTPAVAKESLAAAKAKKAKKFKAPKPKLYCKVPGSCVADPGLFGNNEAASAWVVPSHLLYLALPHHFFLNCNLAPFQD